MYGLEERKTLTKNSLKIHIFCFNVTVPFLDSLQLEELLFFVKCTLDIFEIIFSDLKTFFLNCLIFFWSLQSFALFFLKC